MSQGNDTGTAKWTKDCRETAMPYHPASLLQGKGKNGKAVPVHTRKAYGGVEVQIHSFLNSVLYKVRVQLHTLLIMPTGKSSYSPMNRRLGWPQTQSLHFGDTFPMLGAEPQVLICPTHSSVTKPTTLSYTD